MSSAWSGATCSGIVKCRKGDPCAFVVNIPWGIDARYTRARFQARDAWDESLPVLLSVDETNGVTIDHAQGCVRVLIGATKTDQLPTLRQQREVAAQLRLYNADDADDRFSVDIPFRLRPDVINDAP